MTCHKTDDYYQHLDLTELKVMAQGWANRFSVIKQITLYRADRDGKYVFDVRIDDSDKIEYKKFEERWIDKTCYLDALRNAYITPNTDYYGDWLFHSPEVGDELLSKDDHVLTDSRLVLFSKVQDDNLTTLPVLDSYIEAYHSELQKNDLFPLLRETALKKHARMWAVQYDFLENIILYEAPNTAPIFVKYVIVFNLPKTSDKKLELRIRTLKEMFAIFAGPPEIDDNFYREIYKEQFKQRHREEWLFTTETPEGVVAKCSLALYARALPKPKRFKDVTIFNSKNKETVQDVDDFIRKLTIAPSSGDEIKIKEPKKRSELYNADRLGFYKSGGTIWNEFIKIINNNGSYNVGEAGNTGTATKKEYDKKQSYLKEINKKLISSFVKKFSLQIPKGFKLYERFPREGQGAYKFIFQIGHDINSNSKSKYESYSKEKLFDYLLEITQTYLNTPEIYLKKKIDIIKAILIEKHGMTEGEIKDSICPRTDREEIKEMFSNLKRETPKNPEPNY